MPGASQPPDSRGGIASLPDLQKRPSMEHRGRPHIALDQATGSRNIAQRIPGVGTDQLYRLLED